MTFGQKEKKNRGLTLSLIQIIAIKAVVISQFNCFLIKASMLHCVLPVGMSSLTVALSSSLESGCKAVTA
jgi:hypothetical protein